MGFWFIEGCPVRHVSFPKGINVPPTRSDCIKWGILGALIYKRICMVIAFSGLFRQNERIP